MKGTDLLDTIVAISTPIGESGIGIVRLSGKDALKIADKIFVSKDTKKPSEFKTYTTHYGWIVERLSGYRVIGLSGLNPQTRKPANPQTEIIDEVILTVMRTPKSYTREDIVEINCHSGLAVLRKILDLVLENGARLAQPGEFTQRAFLNGRIDLTQAEAVLDIIRSKTESSLKIGMEQLKGNLSGKINSIRKTLLENLCVFEANIDFPEEEIAEVDLKETYQVLAGLNQELIELLKSARLGRIFREGINLVIAGSPNVGKSSLLNTLLRCERSLVTPIPGTTRDTIEEVINIKGVPVKLVDTAGFLIPRDLIEKKAVQRLNKYMDLADLIILLFDGSRQLTQQDESLIRRLKIKNTIAVINKIDLRQKIERDKILKKFNRAIEISAKKNKNIELLEEEIANLIYNGVIRPSESVLVANTRHIEAIKKAQKSIQEAQESQANNLSLEFIAQGIKDALWYLDELLGKGFSEDLLDKVFSEFCIGK